MHYNAHVSHLAPPQPTMPPSPEPLLAHIQQAQRSHAFFLVTSAPRQPVVVAVSGGADSVALLHALAQLAPDWDIDLHVAHIDHALRPDSAEDAALVHALAMHLQAPFHTTRLDGAVLRRDPAGLEAAARRARYRALSTIAYNVTPAELVPVIVVAHHAQDQAETLLLHLVQGSGLTGLAAMRPVTWLDDGELTPRPVRVVRPLLAAARAEILDYAGRHHLTWREDASNTDETRSRNLIRHAVLPLLARINPQVVETLARTAPLLADDADRLGALDRQRLQQLAIVQDDAHVLIDLAGLQRLTQSEVRGVLRAALRHLHADLREIGAAQVAALAAASVQPRANSGPHPLAGRLAWSVVSSEGAQRLSLHRQDGLPLQPDVPWLDARWRESATRLALPNPGHVAVGNWMLESNILARNEVSSAWRTNAARWTAYFDADKVMAPALTTPQHGFWLAPLGMAGKRKAVGDLFTDAKIAPPLRAGWPIIVDEKDERIIWVCGLAQSHTARITEHTHRIWIVRWRLHKETSCASMSSP